jgi:predicted transcriptional regulator
LHPLAACGNTHPVMVAEKKTRSGLKAQALKIVQSLPAGATWDDLMYRIYVRQKIEAGMADITEGRTHTHAAIRKATISILPRHANRSTSST